ncbi:hypothetical protein Ocin01_02802 [Orchesella cincta]|uniref:Ig-like domain-containing protein n=1 Tax=Orchesella cincta TaxID=48709 RepID=A0A1D2NF14_ORCCI|nr:hypothetical protein Ocin01_02802 [Orchesella cincta]
MEGLHDYVFAFVSTSGTSFFPSTGMLVVVMGLELKSISVPVSGIKGSHVTLSCEFLIGEVLEEKLYSLKWYKDSHEFFRYMPQNKQDSITTFNRPGVQVDVSLLQIFDKKSIPSFVDI